VTRSEGTAANAHVSRITPIVTLGILQESVAVEGIAQQIDAIMSTDDARVPPIGVFVR